MKDPFSADFKKKLDYHEKRKDFDLVIKNKVTSKQSDFSFGYSLIQFVFKPGTDFKKNVNTILKTLDDSHYDSEAKKGFVASLSDLKKENNKKGLNLFGRKVGGK